ncbi:MAG: GGDEF domain-containing protein, partial [Rhodospirillales bacterium]|nr:GGDEF domain-containing protein [Rhodospirillales bacterium]
LERLATTDPLTGAANRRAFFAIAAREIDRMRRHSLPVAVALMDIDYFKRINDTLGHAAGDIVLKRLVERSQAGLRKVDLLGRLGGEEFAVLLPDSDQDGSLIVAERLRKALCDEPILLESGPLTVTASFGLTQLHPGESAELALARADIALYQAKESGRNRVVVA